MSKARRTYSQEFKQETVELYKSSGRSMAELERELGMSQGLLKQWVRQYEAKGKDAFPGQGKLSPQDEEVRRLKREVQILREEREILKKALGIVSDVP